MSFFFWSIIYNFPVTSVNYIWSVVEVATIMIHLMTWVKSLHILLWCSRIVIIQLKNDVVHYLIPKDNFSLPETKN